MKVLVLGAGGMLGSELVKELHEHGIDCVGLGHYEGDVLQIDRLDVQRRMVRPDLVINCAGVCNEGSLVNSLGPWNVSRVFSCKIWHISTDCVFDSTRHKMHRHMPAVEPTPLTEYGVSKRMGEIYAPHVSNIRTSFIGYKHGLLNWFVGLPAGTTVDGWANALWSGSTVYEIAKTLVSYIELDSNLSRMEHLATHQPISKFKLLCALRDRLGRDDIDVVFKEEPLVNRAMAPTMVLRDIYVALSDMPTPVEIVGEAQAYV